MAACPSGSLAAGRCDPPFLLQWLCQRKLDLIGYFVNSGSDCDLVVCTSFKQGIGKVGCARCCRTLSAILLNPGVIAILWSAPPSRKELVKCLFFPESAAGGSLSVSLGSDVDSASLWIAFHPWQCNPFRMKKEEIAFYLSNPLLSAGCGKGNIFMRKEDRDMEKDWNDLIDGWIFVVQQDLLAPHERPAAVIKLQQEQAGYDYEDDVHFPTKLSSAPQGRILEYVGFAV